MALPLGKLTILVGAGIVGSILAKEGGISSVSDFVSGAFKIAYRQLKNDDSNSSVKKPRNDYLVDQVNSLRKELQILASNRPITIVTGRGTGTSKYGIIIVVVVVGYGYVWWKVVSFAKFKKPVLCFQLGWRLPDMMFATRRSLSDAREAIAKQLESVYSSISASVTRRHLSSRIESVDNRLDEIADVTATTQEEVSLIQDKSKMLNTNVQSVRYVVQTLESKIKRIEGKQDMTNEGVNWLCDYAQTMEQNKPTDHIQASPTSSSRLALEAPKKAPSRSGSLPPIVPVELPSPSPSPDSNGTPKVKRSPRNAFYGFGLKEVGESSSRDVSNCNRAPEDNTNVSASSGFFGTMFSGRTSSFPIIARTRSATNAVPQQMGG
ncbi:squamosa promoter-binding-like protein 16-like isoform 1 [Hibiscus syriacus]|uniref:Squamosa promoter-binding-like protein 16-like isoform 1 n=1 Tax=Hibiscus syriacus TaxID=106335 RepID=A0A6A3ASI1_HIBSY|nr:squamosa promoter-binding-like protein 16-like isoform 1 [Hibiscus syriacus]